MSVQPTPGQTFVPRSDFMRVMSERGYIHQCTDAEALDAAARAGPLTAYVGYDCTADSLHIGHLISIMMLRWLQKCGHRPIVLMGGGTTKVGDPTDKDQQRPLLSDETIAANMASIRQTFAKFLTFGDPPSGALMVNNAGWLDALGYVQFLREYGVHFSVNRMLAFDSVRLRLEREQPLSFLEFNYMLMQATDYLELSRRLGCVLQMGGSDQWGNIVNGVELIRRVSGKTAFGLTTPLLATGSGQKMGKTLGGAVWLNAERLSPYDYWQMWRNTEDGDVGRFLRLFTELPLDEIARLEALGGAEINEAKKVLANEATALLHGTDAAEAAAGAAKAAFEEGRLSEDLPTVEVSTQDLAGLSNAALMVLAGFATSNSDARRQIAGGGFRIDGEKVADANAAVTISGAEAELRKGNARKRLVVK
ncbi:MAG TPA: tyrosine--tRNA ligase [Caulobacteraceae bacterium]|jgi:tyrosyl-tRNA synthetase